MSRCGLKPCSVMNHLCIVVRFSCTAMSRFLSSVSTRLIVHRIVGSMMSISMMSGEYHRRWQQHDRWFDLLLWFDSNVAQHAAARPLRGQLVSLWWAHDGAFWLFGCLVLGVVLCQSSPCCYFLVCIWISLDDGGRPVSQHDAACCDRPIDLA